MPEFAAPSPSPARVHERARALVGHHPGWVRQAYKGGLYSHEHFRICSYCRCIHPADLIDLIRAGGWLEDADKPGKYWLFSANPLAGELVRMGSQPIPVFNWKIPPQTLRQRLFEEASERDASMAERLIGHIERPLWDIAPALIRWPFYSEHTNDRQWPEIWAAQGEEKCRN